MKIQMPSCVNTHSLALEHLLRVSGGIGTLSVGPSPSPKVLPNGPNVELSLDMDPNGYKFTSPSPA